MSYSQRQGNSCPVHEDARSPHSSHRQTERLKHGSIAQCCRVIRETKVPPALVADDCDAYSP